MDTNGIGGAKVGPVGGVTLVVGLVAATVRLIGFTYDPMAIELVGPCIHPSG